MSQNKVEEASRKAIEKIEMKMEKYLRTAEYCKLSISNGELIKLIISTFPTDDYDEDCDILLNIEKVNSIVREYGLDNNDFLNLLNKVYDSLLKRADSNSVNYSAQTAFSEAAAALAKKYKL
ncbi:MAG: hypothetical protein CVU92_03440 [Firmicutes bacterium HGW-Firmicutes-17]|jgi:hypothetical protein|nr:MAG: hypothetical protein CVU92_03440 [Firmicutes bacterium HGW-Firmicutes-17]